MFTPEGRLKSRSEHERLLRRRVLEEASALYRVHGAKALDTARRTRPPIETTADERRYERLVVVELERLDREARRSSSFTRYDRRSFWRRFRAMLSGARS